MILYSIDPKQRDFLKWAVDKPFWRLESEMIDRILKQGWYNEDDRKILMMMRNI